MYKKKSLNKKNPELTCRHYRSTPAFHTPPASLISSCLCLFVCLAVIHHHQHLKSRRWQSESCTHWPDRRETSSHHRPHGPGSSPCDAVRGGCGPRLCAVLPLPPLFLPAGDSGALCPDRGGSVWLHLHLHLPGGTDHLSEREKTVINETL